ncbi:MAG TPA: hypothetical protein VJY35_10885 [Candidatus Eisenbacteria bacterium]|nr:hypothetical protein [Candidatus Eisenbacteria bacterium]
MSNALIIMSNLERRRPPISVRHAFRLAFDLAVRRDPLHSLVVPFLLRAPWIAAIRLLPAADSATATATALWLMSGALIGDFVTLLVVGAMLRLRARSVYNLPRETRPAPVGQCYVEGGRRIPRLLVTEVVRNVVLGIAASIMVLPTALAHFRPETAVEDLGRNLVLIVIAFSLALPSLFVVYRLGVATEAVVLDEHDLAAAFQSSFRMMRGHLERWIELILASGALIVIPAMVLGALSVAFPALAGNSSLLIFWCIAVAVWPVIQYAWTFFYLRLVEIDRPVAAPEAESIDEPTAGVAGAGGTVPKLELVPRPKPDVSDSNTSA